MPFEIINQTEYLLCKITGDFNGDEEVTLDKAMGDQIKSSNLKYVVVNCADCGTIGPVGFRQMVAILKELKALNGQLRLVGCSYPLTEHIKRSGLDRMLINKMSLRGVLVDFGLVKQKEFDVNFINPFLNATMKVFKIQCFTEAKAQKPFIKKPTDPLLLGDISGIISITSETFNGTLAISLSEDMFAKIASKMLGEDIKGINEGNVDLIGELANIILGQAKIELGNVGYSIQMALPSCVWGKDHKIKHFGGGVCVVIPFESEFGTFHTEIMTNNNLVSGAKAA